MIKRIELINFMSHEHSVIDLTEGLNVLVGPNNCGKSAIVTALQILCYNDNSTYVLRHESKECSIRVETSDGHEVRWNRKKNGAPWYEIDGERFDRLGKNSVPDRLHEVLRLPRIQSDKDRFDVHFGEQRSPVFLLNEKPRQAADFFASSSDARHLLEMQALHKTQVREATLQKKRLDRESAEIGQSLNLLNPLDELTVHLAQAEQRAVAIEDANERAIHLQTLQSGIARYADEVRVFEKKIKQLKSIPKPPLLNDTDRLKKLNRDLTETERQRSRVVRRDRELRKLMEPPILVNPSKLESAILARGGLEKEVRHLTRKFAVVGLLSGPADPIDDSALDQMVNTIASQSKGLKSMDQKQAKVESQTRQTRDQILDWTKQNPECPTCGGAVALEQLISRRGHQHGSG